MNPRVAIIYGIYLFFMKLLYGLGSLIRFLYSMTMIDGIIIKITTPNTPPTILITG